VTWTRLGLRRDFFLPLVRSECGEALIMQGLSLPILLSFVFGLMQVCLLYYSWEMTSEVARQGARYAIVHGSTCETTSGSSCTVTAAQVESYATGLGWPNLGGGTMSVVATFPDGAQTPGDRVLVTVTYHFPYKIPWVTSTTEIISSSSEMYIMQ
jgi:Flp pilus assembly protein TadG